MLGFRLACLLVQYLEQTARTPRYAGAALLYNVATGAVEAWAADTREQPHDVGTPAVTLQRNYTGAAFASCVILVSQAPTVMCIGMAALTGVRRVVHCAGMVRTGYVPGNDLAATAVYADPGPPPNHPGAITTWLGACEGLLAVPGDFAVAFANVPATGNYPAQVQNAITDRSTTVNIRTPGAPAPADGATSPAGASAEVDAFWMTVARRLTGLIHLGSNHAGGAVRGHNIGCVLVSADNQVLAWGVNTSGNHPTFHAETKCIWMFQRLNRGQLVPAGATLYTTLQSCLMCSGTIKHSCGANAVRVVYADADKVRNSALTAGVGARETPLGAILRAAHRGDLERGQHLLALARLDRIRRAFHAGLDRTLTSARAYPAARDPRAFAHFWAAMSRSRPQVEAQLRQLDNVPRMPAHVLAAVEELVSLKRSAMEAAAGPSPPSSLRGQIGAATGAIRASAQRRFAQNYQASVMPLRARLRQERDERLGVEQAANRLPYSGGAPVLLLNPVLHDSMEQRLQIARPAVAVASLDAALAQTRLRIRDLTTQLHALDLLRRALELRRDYIDH
jgi:tRNA(Arg) A34 adenosine deaminase TadA